MNDRNKHKPLSAEELFKRLDETSGSENDLSGLDDFEKDALEGFATHSNSVKAAELTAELNAAISKKAEGNEKGLHKNKVIWFSAAASIVLIIIVSVFFFNQSKLDTAQNMALNELPDQTIVPPVNSNNDAQFKDRTSFEKESTISDELKQSSATDATLKNTVKEFADPDVLKSRIPEKKSGFDQQAAANEEVKYRKQDSKDDAFKQTEALADITASDPAEKNNLEKERLEEEVSVSQNTHTMLAKSKASGEQNSQTILSKDLQTKKSEEQQEPAGEYIASDKLESVSSGHVQLASAPVTILANSDRKAFYPGNESGIKEFVLLYLKEKNLEPVTGRYKITGNVNAKGGFKTISIVQISREYCNCTDRIEEALNNLKKWNPSIENGKAVTSAIEINITF